MIPLVSEVLRIEARLGRDFDGRSLYSERCSWLDRREVADEREEELLHRLLDEACSIRLEIRAERLETK